jgi:calcineurin-like phosphoesterase family protein
MALWLTADLHLGHANIIRYCDRPFDAVQDMDERLVDRWNERVGEDDTVVVLGDVALGPIQASLSLVSRLAGTKLLVAGNHDRCWAGNGARARTWHERYLDAGFTEVRQGTIDLEVAGRPVRAGHFPYEGDSQDEDRFTQHRPRDDGSWLLHGHVHDRWRQRGRMINVGVDAWAYRPVHEDEVADLLAQGPADLAPLPPGGPQEHPAAR